MSPFLLASPHCPAMDSVDDGEGPASAQDAILSGGVCGSQALLAACFPALDKSLSTIPNLLFEEISAAKDREARLLRKVGELAKQIQTLQERIDIPVSHQQSSNSSADEDTLESNSSSKNKKINEKIKKTKNYASYHSAVWRQSYCS